MHECERMEKRWCGWGGNMLSLATAIFIRFTSIVNKIIEQHAMLSLCCSKIGFLLHI